MEAPAEITCVDCGGPCRLIGARSALDGDAVIVATYRCRDCWDRWDVVIEEATG